jgi:hypothetical protein
VLSVGIDLAPALRSQGFDAEEIIAAVAERCLHGGGQAMAPGVAAHAVKSAGRVLNIAWVGEAVEAPASIICPRATACPRPEPCERLPAVRRAAEIREIRRQIVAEELAGSASG